MDFSIIERAGLTQTQYAELVGVTRVTVNFWVRAKVRPRDIVRSRIALANAALEKAVEAGELPVPADAHASLVKAAIAKVKTSIEQEG